MRYSTTDRVLPLQQKQSKMKETIRRSRSAVVQAVIAGNISRLHMLLERRDWLDISCAGNNLLHLAVLYESVAVLDFVLEVPTIARNVNSTNPAGWSPLFLALFLVEEPHLSSVLIDKLVSAGADVNLPLDEGRTLLHTAAWWPDPDKTATLLKLGARVDCADRAGRTPLHSLGLGDHAELSAVGRQLLDAGADLEAADRDGATPLLFAIEQNAHHHELVTMFLYYGADASVTDREGNTPLRLAICRSGSVELQNLLCLYESDFARYGTRGTSPLTLTNQCTSSEVVMRIWRELSRRGSDLDWGIYGSPLSFCIYHEHPEMLRQLVEGERLSAELERLHDWRVRVEYDSESMYDMAGEFMWNMELHGHHWLLEYSLRSFDRPTALQHAYLLLSHGYVPDCLEAEYVFAVFGDGPLFSLLTQLDLAPGAMSRDFLLLTVAFDVSRPTKYHVARFLGERVCYLESLHQLLVNLRTIAAFFTNAACRSLVDSFLHDQLQVEATRRAVAEPSLWRSVASLQEMCRDVVRDAVCSRRDVRTYGQYRAAVRSMVGLTVYGDILMYRKPLYRVPRLDAGVTVEPDDVERYQHANQENEGYYEAGAGGGGWGGGGGSTPPAWCMDEYRCCVA